MPEPAPAAQASPTQGWRNLAAHRWLRIAVILSVILALALTLTPYGIRYALQRWLLSHGADSAQIEDVDFNPFTGVLALHGVEIKADGQPQLNLTDASIRFGWWELWHKRLLIQELQLNGARGVLARDGSGHWRFAGVRLAPGASSANDEQPWGFGLASARMDDVDVQYLSPTLNSELKITHASLDGLASWTPDQPTRVALQGSLNKAPLDLRGNVSPFTPELQALGRIKLDDFTLAPLAALAGGQVTQLGGHASLNVELSIARSADGLLLRQQGTVALRDLTADVGGENVTQSAVNWDGTLDLHLGTEPEGLRAGVDGQLRVGSGQINAGALQVSQSALTWEGLVTYGKRDVPTGYEANGKLNVDNLRLREPQRALDLAHVGTLALTGLHARGTYDVTIDQADLGDVTIAQPSADTGGTAGKPAVLTAKAVNMATVKLQDLHDLKVAKLQLHDLIATLKRNADGKWYVLDTLSAPASPTAQQPTQAPSGLAIGSASILGDSHVRFEDLTVTPAFKLDAKIQKAEIRQLDSARPTEPSPLVLQARLGPYARLTLNGQVRPFTPRLNLKLKGRVEQVDLPPLSSYTAPQLGYSLTSGHLNADVDLQIRDGHMEGQTELALNKLQVQPQDAKKMEQLTAQLSVPLDSALSMLRDKNDNIHIKVPISGDMDDPRFDFGDAINQALGKTMRLAAVSYIKYALQPYGAIITLVQMTGKAAQTVKLEPALFTAGQDKLTPKTRQYLGKMESLLRERPQLSLRLCPRATVGDRQALLAALIKSRAAPPGTKPAPETKPEVPDQALESLAQHRALALKAYLVEHGVAPGRLYLCKPELDPSANGEPRVEISI